MCGGIRSGKQGRRTTAFLHGCSCRPVSAGLAIVAAFEVGLVQSPKATSQSQALAAGKSTCAATSSRPPGKKSSPIPIPAVSSANEKSEEDEAHRNDNSYYYDKGEEALQSIFSTTISPPGCIYNYTCTSQNFLHRPSPLFLGTCFFCERSLEPGKDIYMYRGDRAFCTIECRYKHMVEDENISCVNSIEQQHA